NSNPEFDRPLEGVGYYILGNDSFVSSNVGSGTAWKYDSAIRMDGTDVDVAYATNIDLPVGAEIKIKLHSYSNYKTIDSWCNYSLVDSSDYATGGGSANIRITEAGNYSVTVTSSSTIRLVKNGDIVGKRINSKASPHINRSLNPTTANKLYLDLNSCTKWENDSARFAAYFYTDSDNYAWVNFTSLGNHKYSVPFPTGTEYKYAVFCRMKGSSNTNNWDNKWNQTQDSKDSHAMVLSDCWDTCKITNWDNSQVLSSSDIPKSTAFLVGEAGVFGSLYTWSIRNAIQMSSTSDPYLWTVTQTFTGSEKFKVMWTNASGTALDTGGSKGYSHLNSRTVAPLSNYFQTTSDDNIENKFGSSFQSTVKVKSDYSLDIVIPSVTLTKTGIVYDSAGTSPTGATISLGTQTFYSGGYSYNPAEPTAQSGYVLALDNWYTNSDFAEGHKIAASASIDVSTYSTIYAKYNLNPYTITCYVVKTAEGTTSTYSSEGGSTSFEAVTGTSYPLSGHFTKPDYHTFVAYHYYTHSTNTIGSQISTNSAYSMTYSADTEICAVYQPTSHNVNFYKSYFDTAAGTSTHTASITSGVSYETQNPYPNPSTPSCADETKAPSGNTWTYYSLETSPDWYTDANCTTKYSVSPARQTADLKLYCKMVAKPTQLIYANIANTNWSTPDSVKLHAWYGSCNSNSDSDPNTPDITVERAYDKYVKFYLPETASFILTNGSTGGSNQSIDLSMASRSGSDLLTSSGAQAGNGNYNFAWNGTFGGVPADGYYLLKDQNSWVKNASSIMRSTSFTKSNIGGYSVIAEQDNVSFNAGEDFRVIHFQVANYGESGWTSANVVTKDSLNYVTTSGNNLDMTQAGNYNVYILTGDKIYIEENVCTFTLYSVHDSTETRHEMNLGDAMRNYGYQDVNNRYYNTATYETNFSLYQGDKIFIKSVRYGTTTTWYGWSAVSNTDTSTNKYGSEATSTTYDAGYTGSAIQITQDGTYTIYLTSENKVAIARVPDRGEGFYILAEQNVDESSYFDYDKAIKMMDMYDEATQDTDNIAEYVFLKVKNGDKFQVRSYEHFVDTSYTTLGEAGVSNVSVSDGTFTIKDFGDSDYHYMNVFIQKNGKVFFAAVGSEDLANSFKMNKVNTANNDVKSQNTSLILRVDFTTTGSVPLSGLSIRFVGNMTSYTLAAMSSVDNSSLNDNPYDGMRDAAYYGSMTAASSPISKSCSISAGSHFVYVIIDYDPSNLASVNSSDSLNMYLTVSQ
ncbi:MAG: hypothetical protein K5694_03350, partial [Bacilli bacterium]|nr:hypothetical protein [Bacilli bacterium]